jgi:NADH dehydrogenase [ubiquinone] 1 alpha subcomplex assembly factor 7
MSPSHHQQWNTPEDDDGYGNPLLYEASSSLSSSSPPSALQPTFMPASWTKGNYEPSTPLWDHILNYITVTGRPISFATYMRWCLTGPYGYYTTNRHTAVDDEDLEDSSVVDSEDRQSLDRYMIGRDFVTAPEISSLFGECLAVWFASQWQRAQERFHLHQQQQHLAHERRTVDDGNPVGKTTSASLQEEVTYQWVECGPGKGTLMQDLLRASVPLNMLRPCTHIHFVEASPVLRLTQRRSLEELAKELPVRFRFVDLGSSSVTHGGDSADDNERGTRVVDSAALQTITVLWHDSLSGVVQWLHPQHQRGVLQESTATSGHPVLPSKVVTFCICQEFVDALPVYSFQKTSDGWRERLIDVAMEDNGDNKDDYHGAEDKARSVVRPKDAPIARDSRSRTDMKKPRLRVVLAPELTPSARTLLRTDHSGFMPGEDPATNIGSIVEVNPEGILLVRDIANLIGGDGSGLGAALIIDYGGEGSCDSIRAFSRHEQVSFLSRPGLVDITADVDFAALRHAVNYNFLPSGGEDGHASDNETVTACVRAYGPVTQGAFLLSMGLQERVLAVIEDDRTDEDHAENLYQSMVRLASPDEMGERFKVLAIVHHDGRNGDQPPPLGFLP